MMLAFRRLCFGDIDDALQIGGLEGTSELQLAPDFAGVVADIRESSLFLR